MKLVVGLGNPGKEYKNTRHNVGFWIVDEYLGKVRWKIKSEAYFYIDKINNQEVLFLKPLTYMNLSGIAISKIVKYYKIAMKDILIIHDDLDISLGDYKIKRNSSSGGHNGIKSIIYELNSEEFGRLKVGIGKDIRIPTEKYVLGKFSTAELEKISKNMETYKNIIDTFINKNIEKCMQLYNKN